LTTSAVGERRACASCHLVVVLAIAKRHTRRCVSDYSEADLLARRQAIEGYLREADAETLTLSWSMLRVVMT
jgi:hypothetical protein